MFQPLSLFNRNRNLPTPSDQSQSDPFFRLQHEMNRLFDEAFAGFGTTRAFGGGASLTPTIDLRETKDALEAQIELPGVSEDDIDVQVVDNTLTVRGEKRFEKTEERDNGGFRYVERSYGSFARSIPLPVEIDPDRVDAVFKDGVLKLTLGKLPQAKSRGRRIEIKRG